MSDNNLSEVPKDISAEKIVLGSLLLSKDAMLDVVSNDKPLEESHFSELKHQIIYSAILELEKDGSPIDAVSVADVLKRRGNLDKAGGINYISDLTNPVSNPANALYYANILKDKAVLRRLVEAGQKITKLGFGGQGEISSIIGESEKSLYSVTEESQRSSANKIGNKMDEVLIGLDPANSSKVTRGIMSGLTDLDNITNGFNPGRLIILAARPAVGKSSLVLNFARNAAFSEKKKVLMFSLEMSTEEILQRTFSAEADVDLSNIQRKQFITAKNWADIKKAGNKIQDSEFYIDDGGNSINEIASKIRRMKQSVGLDMVIVDYIGLISSSSKVESRHLEIAAYSRQFKTLANDLKIPIIVLAQLNRDIEKRPRKSQKPMLSDLRESGSLEQDADIVLFLYREEETTEEDAFKENENQHFNNHFYPTNLQIAKHRNGATGNVKLVFIGNRTKFENAAKDNQTNN